MLGAIIGLLEKVVEALNTQGAGLTLEQLLNQLQEYLRGEGGEPDTAGPPSVSLTYEGEVEDEHVFALRHHNMPGEFISFQIKDTDFDPDEDGYGPELLRAAPGEALEARGWGFGVNYEKGRVGGYTSRLSAIRPVDTEQYGNVVCYLNFNDNTHIELSGIGIYGYYPDGDHGYFVQNVTINYAPSE